MSKYLVLALSDDIGDADHGDVIFSDDRRVRRNDRSAYIVGILTIQSHSELEAVLDSSPARRALSIEDRSHAQGM